MNSQPLDFQTLQTENTQDKLEEGGNQLNQNTSWTITTTQKKIKTAKSKRSKATYSPTKVKARNFLSNIAYRRISMEDFTETSFIIDIYTYLAMDLKPFFLNATFSIEEDREMIKML